MMWLYPLSMPMVTVEDEGRHGRSRHVDDGSHVEGRHLWATPMVTVEDEGGHL